jgi:pyruvate dehydrogenase E2 component (dihydrolipoamide acetyltransferase)
MPVNIEMPKLSDTMTEGTLLKWHKKIGDAVEAGDIIAEIETDKATMEMEAFDDGYITEIRVHEGEKAPIGTILAILNESLDQAPAIVTISPETVSIVAPQTQSEDTTLDVSQNLATTQTPTDRIKASPLARKVAEDLGVDLSTVKGSGPNGRIIKNDVASIITRSNSSVSVPSDEATAAAALTASIKLKGIQASLPVENHPGQKTTTPVTKTDGEIVVLSTLRKIIASRLLISKTTIPHFYLHVEVNAAPLMSLRHQINEQAEKTHGNKYSVNDFILKAVINATEAVPAVNASFNGDHILKYRHVGLSIAIAVEDGLVTPVIKEAETKSLLEISRSVKDFAQRAKAKKLKPDEFDGGTVTVSNLGAWGIECFDAIINPPQAAILSVGAALEKPIVKNGQVVPGLCMNLGLSCDHRVIDGAVGAQFLQEIKKLIERPSLMLL